MIKIDKSFFTQFAKDYDVYDSNRESLVKKSRDVIKESKRVLFSMHRGEKVSLSKMEQEVEELKNIVNNDDRLKLEGSFNVAMQEYVEAKSYFFVLNERRLPDIAEFGVSEEEYVLGLCDLTGELSRKAVVLGNARDVETIGDIKEFLYELYSYMLLLNPRNGNLRKKIDSIKWNIQKVEDILFNLNR